jgi:hypothetical protein
MDVDSIRVYSPKSAVLLCGGLMTGIGDPTPKSMRDAFYKVTSKPFLKDAELTRVEDIQEFHRKETKYSDFLEFESDLAQLCDLIILFSESPGSFAELGAFARDADISGKLFTVIRKVHYQDESFISLGPIAHLRNKDLNSIFVIDDEEFGIIGDNYTGINKDLLARRLADPLSARLVAAREHTKFDRRRNGHLCKLITALVQEFGALTIEELVEAFGFLGVKVARDDMAKLVFCLRSLEWVTEERRGLRDFVFANGGREAAKLVLTGDGFPRDKDRRRTLIREYWKSHDDERFFAVSKRAPLA